jgi:type VI secretion system protein ImpL
VSEQTAVDSTGVWRAFEPVKVITPPTPGAALGNEVNGPYITALGALQSQVEQLASNPDPGAADQARNARAQAVNASRAIMQRFHPDSLHVLDDVQRLLDAPLRIESVISGMGAASANDAGKVLCGQVHQLMGKFPFSPQSGVAATIDEVTAIFSPQGAVWTYAAGPLASAVVRQGTTVMPKAGVTPKATPEALRFFQKAAQVTDALYGDAGTDPQFRFTLKPTPTPSVPRIDLRIDGQSHVTTTGDLATTIFTWTGKTANTFQITVTTGGVQQPPLTFTGTWALFRFFQQADPVHWARTGTGKWSFVWHAPDHPADITFELGFASEPIFRRDYFSGLACPSHFAQ